MSLRDQVRAFHRAFGVPMPDKPCVPDDETVRLRLRLIAEEFFELLEAGYLASGDIDLIVDARRTLAVLIDHGAPHVNLAKFADALADLDYVNEGARLAFGIDGGPIADAVHASNMAKLGPDGRPILRADGKVVKPAGWQPPNIEAELVKQGWVKP